MKISGIKKQIEKRKIKMIMEILGGFGLVGGGMYGLVTFVNKGVPNIKERKSIKNIEKVITKFLEGKLSFQFIGGYGSIHYCYKEKNFRMDIQERRGKIEVIFRDQDLQGTGEFFYFSYDSKTLQLIEVRENSGFYRNHGYYDTYTPLFRKFMNKVMSIDWENKENQEKEMIKRKYNRFDFSSVSLVTDEEMEKKHIIVTTDATLSEVVSHYETLHAYVMAHFEQLSTEQKHHVERDYEQVKRLVAAYEALDDEAKKVGMNEVTNPINLKIDKLQELKTQLSNQSWLEFKKIAEVMKE